MTDPATQEPAASQNALVAQGVNGQKSAPLPLRCAPRAIGMLRRAQMADGRNTADGKAGLGANSLRIGTAKRLSEQGFGTR